MQYKYAGKTFDIELNDEGKIECAELGIVLDKVDEVKAEIRKQTEVEKKLPRIPVFFVDRYGDDTKYLTGETTGKNASASSRWAHVKEVWVTWKDERKTHRQKMFSDRVYPATEENRQKLDKYVKLKGDEYEAANKARELLESVEYIEVE